MNQLQYETSPYLLQHAHNPVDWYAWKPEAFERAKAEDKPILVSIGYSTCHWCHVMERESFENEQIAAFMNQHFINIKVDREERPDVDQIYMEACHIISGSGGWPLNCFLTPDGRPFFAGTYYPPVDAYNRPSWAQVLQNIANAFATKRQTVEEQADQLTGIIQKSDQTFISDQLQITEKDSTLNPKLLHNIYEGLEKQFDSEDGGFGAAPKFPGTMPLEFLLEYHYHFKEEKALKHVLFSLDKMVQGGIYDQLGGGFARYATDKKWLIPHFEKMLYDNALLVGLLANAWSITQKKLYKDTIEETLDYIQREMTSPEGGFYTALDADSEGEEGKFYIWSKGEVEAILGEDAALFCAFYDISEAGNWEGKSILWRPLDLEAFAKANQEDAEALSTKFKAQATLLLEARSKRVRPGLDDKILLSWNALMCSAYAKAAAALKNEAYKSIALRNLTFILEKFRQADNQSFYHTYKDGKAQYEAFLNDYAFLIAAILDVYTVHQDIALLEQASELCRFVIAQFLDSDSNLFYFTSEKQQDILLRRKELYDSAIPSGNATMVRNLQNLGILLEEKSFRDIAAQMLLSMSKSVERYPSSFSRWASGLLNEVVGMHEIAILGSEASRLADTINALYIPNKLLMASEAPIESYPLTRGKSIQNDTNIYVCQNYACKMPVKTIEDFKKLISTNRFG